MYGVTVLIWLVTMFILGLCLGKFLVSSHEKSYYESKIKLFEVDCLFRIQEAYQTMDQRAEAAYHRGRFDGMATAKRFSKLLPESSPEAAVLGMMVNSGQNFPDLRAVADYVSLNAQKIEKETGQAFDKGAFLRKAKVFYAEKN